MEILRDFCQAFCPNWQVKTESDLLRSAELSFVCNRDYFPYADSPVPIRVPQSGFLPNIDPPARTCSFAFQVLPFPFAWFLIRNVNMLPEHKYNRIERERRFLLEHFPNNVAAVRVRRITDLYIMAPFFACGSKVKTVAQRCSSSLRRFQPEQV
jgi:hypothetical protein